MKLSLNHLMLPALFMASAAVIGYNVLSSEKTQETTENTPSTKVSAVSAAAPLPDGEAINWYTKTNNAYFIPGSEEDEVYLYIRMQGGKAVEEKERAPLNLGIVLDHSGSMSGEGKLNYAKKAVDFVIDNLKETDNLSVVIYDDEIETIRKSQFLTDKQLLKQEVNRITPDGTTNLSGGMLEGYVQAKSTYDEKRVNRILLLSDGLANEGITDPEQINRIAQKKRSEEGISISTFGVGNDFDEDMMMGISEYGSGNYYFIGSPDKIPEIFAKELEGLLAVVAQNTKLQINFSDSQLELQRVYGYTYNINSQGVEIDFKDVFAEEEKAILLKFKRKAGTDKNIDITSTLTYDNAATFERVTLEEKSTIKKTTSEEKYAAAEDEEVVRNISVFTANYSMEEALKEVDNRNFDKAKGILDKSIEDMEKKMEEVEADSNMVKQYEGMKKYRKELDEAEEMGEVEFKYYQKSNKSSNYNIKKRK